MKLTTYQWTLIALMTIILALNTYGIVAYPSSVDKSMRCLALNIYHEARDQSLEGQLAVGYVPFNRVDHNRFPNDICKVIQQHKQFSWFSDGKSDTPIEKLAWENAKRHALYVATHPEDDVTNGATHYHAIWLKPPYWTKGMSITAVIDGHIFYIDKE